MVKGEIEQRHMLPLVAYKLLYVKYAALKRGAPADLLHRDWMLT